MATPLVGTVQSKLSGVLVAALSLIVTALAFPASAWVAGPGTGTVAGDVTSIAYDDTAGGLPPVFSGATSSSEVTTITLQSSHTVLNFSSLNLTSGDTLHLVFAHATHSVLIRVPGPAAINGRITSSLPGGAAGGNLIVSAPGGIAVGGSADVDAGTSLLATTAATTDADFFARNSRFTDAAGSISVSSGASIDGPGLVGFVAPAVTQAGSVGGNEALYGSAGDFSLTHDQTTGQLQDFTPVVGAAAGSVELVGPQNGRSVAVSTLATQPGGGRVLIPGALSPSGAVASGYGYITLAAGGGVQRGTGADSAALLPVPNTAAPPQAVGVTGTITGLGKVRSFSSGATTVNATVSGNDVVLHAVGDLTVGHSGAITAASRAVMSTASNFVNNSGSDAITTGGAGSPGQWIVYADDRVGNTYGGLNSGNTALWGDTLATRGPGQVGGNRYVFGSEPTLTFTSLDDTKTYGNDAAGSLDYTVSGFESGEPGAFLADTPATAFSGAPLLSSDGAAPDVAVPVPAATFPIAIAQGTLASDAGYGFAFNGAGRLSVVSKAPETTEPQIEVHVTGTQGSDGWYTSDVDVSWTVTDPESGVAGRDGCNGVTVTSDTTARSITCSAVSAGGTTSQTVTIKRDTAAPALAPKVSPDPPPLNGQAVAAPNATDATSGIATATCEPVDTSALGTHRVTCTASDRAGHTSTASVNYVVGLNKLVGFFVPVDNGGVLNQAKAGQAVPLKWRFLDADDRPISSLASVKVAVSPVSCATGQATDVIEQYASAAGESGLQNTGDGYYQFNWKSLKSYQGTCKAVTVDVLDGTTPLTALFRFVK